MDLLDRIDALALACPERVALRGSSGSLTYAELRDGSIAVAAWVWSKLGEDRSPVAVVGHKEPEMLLAFLGSVKAGHPYIPLESRWPRARIEQVLATSRPGLVLTPHAVRQALQAALPDPPRQARLHEADPFYVMFTSGSTGEPKGVVITLRNLTSFLEWMSDEHRFQERETFLNQAPFSFDLSVMDTYSSLISGGTLVSLTTRELEAPRELFETLRSTDLTTWVSTPSFARMCVAERSFGAQMLPRLRRFLFCGETLPSALARQLLDRFPSVELWNTYGPTECTVATTSVRIDRDLLERYPVLPVGRPMPGTRIAFIADESGAVADAAVEGEIAIAGPNVSPGYLHQPELTRARFFQLGDLPAYRTGDLGHLQDGLVFFEGRVDNQVKLHGYRIEIGDVEANLRLLPEVRDAAVIPIEQEGRVEALAGFVLVDRLPPVQDASRATLELRRQLAERVPAYMVPRVLLLVDTWPITLNGKVDRRALATRYA
jgi:D-alanine--poly(phosphoribitol) ligase subunit 1